ncbi:MAG: hypothetical protein QOG99_3463, partial [Frankiales bacterium]|nr:hypothetical protein [Frankiales bacterium]
VTFLGTVDHQVLKGAFQACQAFVFPTLQDLIGRVVVEALSAGAPVIVSSMTGAVGTIVHDGVNGIVVDPQDASALADAMHRAANPETSRALGDGVQWEQRCATPRGGRRGAADRDCAGAGRPRRTGCEVDGLPGSTMASQTGGRSAD